MEQRRFDLVLLDLRMPGMDGMAVLGTIKHMWPETEVVVITGYPNVESAKEAVRLGAYGYLAKPVGPADVINAANDAVMHKKWTLRKDAADQDTGPGSHIGAWGKTGSLAC
jgi:DNA-binding NtrC family response regulator